MMPRPMRLPSMRGALSDGALYAWGERLFTPLLHSALAAYQSQWDVDFLPTASVSFLMSTLTR